MNSPDYDNEQHLRARYLEAARQIDASTASRLRAARRVAIEAADQPRHSPLARLLLPTGAFAMLVLASLMLWQPGQPSHVARPVAPMRASMAVADADNDLPPDPDSADAKLYQNLDFYGWLAASNAQRR